MNIINQINKGYLDYQHTWYEKPDVLFINIRDYHNSVKNKEVGMFHIMEIVDISRGSFNDCRVFWVNNETFKPCEYYEKADLIRVIQHEQGYLSSDFKLRKIKIEQDTWMNDGTAAAKIKSPVPMDFIQIDSLAINEYIKRKGGRDYIHKVLSDYWRKR